MSDHMITCELILQCGQIHHKSRTKMTSQVRLFSTSYWATVSSIDECAPLGLACQAVQAMEDGICIDQNSILEEQHGYCFAWVPASVVSPPFLAARLRSSARVYCELQRWSTSAYLMIAGHANQLTTPSSDANARTLSVRASTEQTEVNCRCTPDSKTL